MSFELTTTTKILSQQTTLGQQIILEIEDIGLRFGAAPIEKKWQIGEEQIGDAELVVGGLIEDPNSRAYISLDGTTTNIRQQLEIDKGGSGSVQRFIVSLLDKNQELTELFTPGNVVTDILSKEANVYINFVGGSHPEDSLRIFNGIITSQEARPGTWKIGIDHPEFLKRQDLWEQINTNLDGAITDVEATITVDNDAGFIAPGDVQKSYLLIEEELIEYTSFTGNVFSGLTRGALGTIAAAHDDEEQITSFYSLDGGALDLALKVMLSNSGNTSFETGRSATRFESVTNALTIENGILFESRIKDNLGLEIGDLVTITGASEGANNVTDAAIGSFQDIPQGTVIILTGVSLVEEIDSSAVASFKSQFNTLPVGCGMKPSQVDVAQHLFLQSQFTTGLPDYNLYLKDTINAKDFLTEQIYRPQGFYQVPRKGRASVNITQTPLVLDDLAELTDVAVKGPEKNSIDRQLTREFFNNVVYKFDEDTLENKFKAGEVVFSQRSADRINVGNKTLKIESGGLRDSADTRNFIKKQARRFSDRYQFAAESIKVETTYKSGFNVEISDVVLFGNSSLQIPDIKNGSRDFEPRLMECINKSMNLKDGKITMRLLDTGFGIDGRFGVVSCNSFIDASATTTSIPLKKSFTTGEFDVEREKWRTFISEEIRIRSLDFTFDETVTLVGFDQASTTRIIVDPPLSLAPSEDYIVDLPAYSSSTAQTKMKSIHVFINPELLVVSGISTTSFTVSAGDAALLYEGSIVQIHNDDFTINSTPGISDDDPVVTDITGTTVTVDKDIGFTPASGYKINLVGFIDDEGLPYRIA